MSQGESFHDAIERLQKGDDRGAYEIYERFADRLIRLAHSRLDPKLQAKADPESVAQSVFGSFFARHAQGQFELDDWDSLWSLLVRITIRKCCRRATALHAERRDVRREVGQARSDNSSLDGWQGLARDPTPEEGAALTETLERLLMGLDENQQTILAMRLQGYTVQEISERVGRTERSIYRLLRLVRDALARFEQKTLD